MLRIIDIILMFLQAQRLAAGKHLYIRRGKWWTNVRLSIFSTSLFWHSHVHCKHFNHVANLMMCVTHAVQWVFYGSFPRDEVSCWNHDNVHLGVRVVKQSTLIILAVELFWEGPRVIPVVNLWGMTTADITNFNIRCHLKMCWFLQHHKMCIRVW